MTMTELAMECKRVIEADMERITLVLPGESRGERRTLCGRGSPLSEPILCRNGTGTVCHFNAIKVLAWIAGQGFVKVEAVVKAAPHPASKEGA